MKHDTTPHLRRNHPRALSPRAALLFTTHRSSFIAREPRRAFTPAFTLVELMVSIAMVVLLLVGIHQVFRMSSNTIGTGQAVNAITREIRSAQAVMQEDFRRSLKESPLFVISSQPAAVIVDPENDPQGGLRVSPDPINDAFHFNTRAERDRDIDGNPATIDRDGDGNEEITYNDRHLAQVNDRIHRADIFGFFARGLFNRQTANDGLYVSNTKAYDAWITYGHVRLPDPVAGGYWDPGVTPAANPESENQFAANWVLGRRAILMKDPGSLAGEAFIDIPASGAYLGPLAYNSPINRNGSPGASMDVFAAAGGRPTFVKSPTINMSRLDVAGMTLETYRSELLALRQAVPLDPSSWMRSTWWNPLVFRYECDPRVRKPITSANLAKTTPYFVGNVSQFLVEFAGDFISQFNDPNQANYGEVSAAVPDGVIDFVMLDPDIDNQTNPRRYPDNPRVRKTRWYGLPRDSNGDGDITGVMTNNGAANAMPDVVPVYDVIVSNNAFRRSLRPPFEVAWPGSPGNDDDPARGRDAYNNVDPATFRYVCAWTGSAPAMVRIVMKLEDPAGRLADGQWVEFVLDAP